MERVIDVTTARRQLGTLLDEVFYKGDIITIERKGKPLAKIIAVEETDSQLSSEQHELLEELHSLPTISTDQNPTTILRKIRVQKMIKAKVNYAK
jgi:prevent-host-death family protein